MMKKYLVKKHFVQEYDNAIHRTIGEYTGHYIMHLDTDVAELAREGIVAIKGLYGFCPDNFAFAPADIFIAKLKALARERERIKKLEGGNDNES